MTIHAPTKPKPREYGVYRPADSSPAMNGDREGDWGPWLLDADAWVLFIDDHKTGYYEISLRSCHSDHAILNWITHLHEKTWAGPEVLGGFVAAIDDIIGMRDYRDGGPSDPIGERVARAAARYPEVGPGGGASGDPDILAWDHCEQPDMDRLALIIDARSRGRVHITEIDTGEDQYAIAIHDDWLTADDATAAYNAECHPS